MSELDDALSDLSPDDRAKWAAQFGQLPQTDQPPVQLNPAPDVTPPPADPNAAGQQQQDWQAQSQYGQNLPTTPTLHPAPDVVPPPVDLSAAGQQQQDWDAQRSRGQNIPVRPPPSGYEKSGGQWEVDDDGVERFYVPEDKAAEALPKSTGTSDLKDYVSRLDQKLNGPSVPVATAPRSTGPELAASVGESEKNASMPVENKALNDRQAAEENVRRILSGRPTIEEQAKQRNGENVRRILQGLPTLEEENAKRIKAGLPTVEEERRKLQAPNASATLAQNQPPPGAGYALNAAAIPVPQPTSTMDVGPITVSHPAAQAPMTLNARGAPLDPWEDPLNQPPSTQLPPHPSVGIGGQPAPMVAQGVQNMTAPPSMISPDLAQPLTGPSGARQGTATAVQVRPGMVDPDTGLVAGWANRPDPSYPPYQYIPGKRTPAMWSVTEGQPVPNEDQVAVAAAREGQQGAVEEGKQAGIGGAQASAADLVARQKAIADVDALNRQRQLQHQQALQAQTDKLQSMVSDIRNRPDDDQMFLLPGAAGSFFAAIGQAIGAGAAARTGGKNFAAEMVQGKVNEMVQKQRMQLEKDKSSLGAQESLLGQMRKQFGDDEMGDQAAKIALLERAKLHSDEVAQTSQIPRIAANASALSADLTMAQAKEQTGFDMAAKDHVVRRDVMTKPQVIGGPPAGVGSEEAGNIVQLGDYSLAGFPENTQIALQSPTDRQEATRVIAAHAAIRSAIDDLQQFGKDNPSAYVPYTKANTLYKKKIETITTLQGELRGQSRMPNKAELEKMYDYWSIGPTNLIGGASIEDRAKAAAVEADRIASAKISAVAANEAERKIGRNAAGQVRPVYTYKGNPIARQPLPASARPVGGTSGGYQRGGPAPVDLTHPRVVPLTPAPAGKRGGKPGKDQVGAPPPDEDEDEGEGEGDE